MGWRDDYRFTEAVIDKITVKNKFVVLTSRNIIVPSGRGQFNTYYCVLQEDGFLATEYDDIREAYAYFLECKEVILSAE